MSADIVQDIVLNFNSKDAKAKAQAMTSLESLLTGGEEFPDEIDVSALFDCVKALVDDSNPKICAFGLSVFRPFATKSYELPSLASQFGMMFESNAGVFVERLGDSKPQVRDNAVAAFELMLDLGNTKSIFDRCKDGFAHKSPKIREQLIRLLALSMERDKFRPSECRSFLDTIVRGLTDQQANVRDAAVDAVVSMYRQLGPAFRDRFQQQQTVRPTQLREILQRMDAVPEEEVRCPPAESPAAAPAELARSLPTKSKTPVSSPKSTRKSDEVPSLSSTGSMRRAAGIPPTSRTASTSSGSGVQMVGPIAVSGDVLPIRVHSDRDLASEMDKIKTLLSSTNWEKRAEGCKRIQGLVLGGAASVEGFRASIVAIKAPIAAQIKDSRSNLSKEASTAVALLAHAMGDSFDVLADHFIEYLLPLTYVSIQIISEPAVASILAIMQFVQINKTIKKLFEAVTDKHKEVREVVAKCMYQLLVFRSPAFLSKFCDELEGALRTLLADAQKETREEARIAFWAYNRHFPDRANRLLSTLKDATARTYITSAQHIYLARVSGDSEMGDEPSAPSTALSGSTAFKAKFNTFSGRTRPPVLDDVGDAMDLDVSPLTSTASSTSSSRTVMSASARTAPKRPALTSDTFLPGSAKQTPLSASHAIGSTSRSTAPFTPSTLAHKVPRSTSSPQIADLRQCLSEENEEMLGEEDEGEWEGPVASLSLGYASVPTPKSLARSPSAESRSSATSKTDKLALIRTQQLERAKQKREMQRLAARSPSPARSTGSLEEDDDPEFDRRSAATAPMPALRLAPKPSATFRPNATISALPSSARTPLSKKTTASSSSSTLTSTAAKALQRTQDSRPAMTPARASSTAQLTSLSTSKKAAAARPEAEEQQSLTSLITRTKSTDWQLRIRAFEQLIDMYKGSTRQVLSFGDGGDGEAVRSSSEIVREFERVVLAHVDRLSDNHYRVTEAALKSLLELGAYYHDQFLKNFEKVLPKVLLCLGHSKREVKDAAEALITFLDSEHSSAELLPVYLKALSMADTKVKVAALDLIGRAIPDAVDYLKKDQPMKVCVNKLLQQAGEKHIDVRRSLTAAFDALFTHCTEPFLSFVVSLPTADQSATRQVLAKFLPAGTLDTHIAAFIKQKKGGSRASSRASSRATSPVRGALGEETFPDDDYESTSVVLGATVSGPFVVENRLFAETRPVQRPAYAVEPKLAVATNNYLNPPPTQPTHMDSRLFQPAAAAPIIAPNVNVHRPTTVGGGSSSAVRMEDQYNNYIPGSLTSALSSSSQQPMGLRPASGMVDQRSMTSSDLYSAPTERTQAWVAQTAVPQPASTYRPMTSTTHAALRAPEPTPISVPSAEFAATQQRLSNAIASASTMYEPKMQPSFRAEIDQLLQRTSQAVLSRQPSVQSLDAGPLDLRATLSELASSPTAEGLAALISHASDPSVADALPEVISVLSLTVRDPKDQVRERTAQAFQALITHLRLHFVEFNALVFDSLLYLMDGDGQALTSGENALMCLADVVDPFQCLQGLYSQMRRFLETERHRAGALQSCIKFLTSLVPRMSDGDLLGQLPSFMPTIQEAFKSSNADVRKAVTYCFVELKVRLGENFAPYLADLNTSQLKLVQMYLDRRIKK